MRTIAGSLFAAALVAAACTAPERPRLGTDTLPTTTIEAADDADAEVESEDPDDGEPDEPEGPVGALITPTGVVVPVRLVLGDVFLITTPCGTPSSIEAGTPVAGIDVVLDPGHGGEVETGAVGPNGLTEKELNLDVAERTAAELESRGIATLLTRTGDYRLPIVTRAEIANRLGARAVVSIHHNAPNANPSDTPGTEVFVQLDEPESTRLGALLQEEIVDMLDDETGIEWTTASDAGVLVVLNDEGTESYGMIRRPEVPAALVELGYLSNPTEAELFATDRYRDRAATALADAIERWLTTDDEGIGVVDEPRSFTPTGGTGGVDGCVDPALE